MRLSQLPLIYNIDQVRIYQNNKKICEQWIGAHPLYWYLIEDTNFNHLLDCKIESMGIVIEGCLSKIVVCEIYLK